LPHFKPTTLGVDIATKNIVLSNGQTVKAQIWDTTGKTKSRDIGSAYYSKAVGAILVYDST
jgi:Ras-related protein Rab-11A